MSNLSIRQGRKTVTISASGSSTAAAATIPAFKIVDLTNAISGDKVLHGFGSALNVLNPRIWGIAVRPSGQQDTLISFVPFDRDNLTLVSEDAGNPFTGRVLMWLLEPNTPITPIAASNTAKPSFRTYPVTNAQYGAIFTHGLGTALGNNNPLVYGIAIRPDGRVDSLVTLQKIDKDNMRLVIEEGGPASFTGTIVFNLLEATP